MTRDIHRKRGIAAATIGALLLAAGLVGVATPAAAAVQATLYISTSGSGTICSSASPCSLGTAMGQVESLTASMTGDLVVELEAGTYTRTSAITFGASDSGENGYTVTYEAVPGQSVVISGGATVSGWTLHDSGKNIWEATMPAGVVTRQLYVNGVLATLAEQNASVLGTISQTSSSYTISNTAVASWPNVSDLEFVYPGGGQSLSGHGDWTSATCGVSGISGTTVSMKSCYTDAYSSDGPEVNLPTYVQNNYNLLGQPGQFYEDSSAGVIYYVPRTGEDLSTATTIVGSQQTLVNVAGTTASPVHDLTVSGMTFEYTTWIPGANGVVPLQADALMSGSPSAPTITMLPAAVALHTANHVTVSGNTLQHLGTSGVSSDGGGSYDTIQGNLVTDVAGNGIEVGVGPIPSPPSTLESYDTISDNDVHHVAVQYAGGVGIYAGYVEHTSVEHNEVWDIPYTGISLGWGWGGSGTQVMVDNHVDYNHVHDAMNSSLVDGGGIYVNNWEGSSPASTVSYNYVSDIANGQGIYLDNGTQHWAVSNNAVARLGAGGDWLKINDGTNNTATTNYSDTSVTSIAGGNTVSAASPLSSGAGPIISGAGLESSYSSLAAGGLTSNLAYGLPSYVSSSASGSSGSLANDGTAGSGWQSSSTDTAATWEVDLGGAYPLSDIQVLFRQDTDNAATTQNNFAIWVSNSADMSTHTVACSQGAIALPFRSTYDCAAPSGTFRYIQVVKTDTAALALNEVRVFGLGSAGTADTNLALAGTASASSTLNGSYPPSNAIDGSTSTGWSPTGTDTAAQLEVDLGTGYALSTFQMVTRQDLDQGAASREYFAVWVSNTADMSTHTVACNYTTPALAYQSTYSCSLTTGTWRYVSLVKTDGTYWFIPEVRIFGHASAADTNLAPAGSATATSTYSSSYSASKAIDNDISTGWSPTGTDTAAELDLDLGAAYTLSTFQLVTRQDLDQGPTTRENFAVWVSNTAGMSIHTVACTLTTPALAFQATYSCALPAGTWRYVSAVKTDGAYWFISEVRAYGH